MTTQISNDQCGICGRLLNVDGEALSRDCGGHCWGCVGETEAALGFEPSVQAVLDEWRRGLRPKWFPSALTLNPTFAELRETPLHLVTGAQWEPYYAQMAPYLHNARRDIREMAIERLMMAVFRSDARNRDTQGRLKWLLAEIEAAHRQHRDLLPEFLRGLRWHGDDYEFPSVLVPWLNTLEASPPAGVDLGLVRGARILISPRYVDGDRRDAEWISYLDDTSDWVRGCAARQLATCVDDDNAHDYVNLIAVRELERPGVAGPFAGEFYSGLDYGPWRDAPTMATWMMDLLERRQRPAPSNDNMPFNDIEFHLHELCSRSPEYVRRMIDGGFFRLAWMTATEERDPHVPEMRPLIEELTRCDDHEVAERATRYLAATSETS